MSKPFSFAPTLLALLLAPIAKAGAEQLTVAWRDKPPYHYLENGMEHGFLLQKARQIFADSGLSTQFVREPSKRIWANFQGGVKNYCSFGWYRLPEREALVQFSLPFHKDPPHTLIVAPPAAGKLAAHPTLAAVLADKQLSLGVVDGVSYGAELDLAISRSANQVIKRTVDPAAMAKMVAAGRVAYMFMDLDDWNYTRERDPSLRNTVRQDYADMPPGLQRYIICSKDVPAEWMSRINKAIRPLQ